MNSNSDEVSLLVVEDDDIDFMTIQRSFAKMKIANPLIRAIDGVEALNILMSGEVSKPFIVLLDLNMPRMGGHELLNSIRSTEGIADTVIFILTSSADEKDILKSYQYNVAGYFVKEEAGQGFLEILSLLNGYWRIACLPKK
ncbi:response regulator [Marinomonas sp. C2222]|uniref:Response regulator n=1 Tax=Marinomonas sargassi TaxID=2984494 RepID=A0ABT2YRM0_9GAMM|nr:response regulator [Marinomonas sargassi]MCV2402533.1 response regulator [Marinomonas sargassi]